MSSISNAAYNLLVLSFIKNIGPACLRSLCSADAGLQLSLSDCQPSELGDYLLECSSIVSRKRKEPVSAGEISKAAVLADEQVQKADNLDVSIICSLDEAYPQRLRLCKDDPVMLYVKGSLSCLNQNSAAVIGSRQPTAHAEIIAQRVSDFLIAHECCIVSGLAYGCDSLAHRQCVQHGSPTVAVLGHGLQTIYPKEHAELAAQIIENGGALVSQFHIGEAAKAYTFAARDAVQAGMSDFTLLIQSALDGGSMIASGKCLEYGRTLAVISPTQKDRAQFSDSCRANILLTDVSIHPAVRISQAWPKAKKGSFGCSKILPIAGKDDYPQLVKLFGSAFSRGDLLMSA